MPRTAAMTVSRASAGFIAAALLLGACGGDDNGGAIGDGGGDGAVATTLAPEDVTTSDSAVADGLADIKARADKAAELTGRDKDAAVKETEDIHEVWEGIEGTVKANDEDAYLALEDAFAKLEKAAEADDSAKAAEAAAAVNKSADAYLEAHPG